jgi:hypothetical protein
MSLTINKHLALTSAILLNTEGRTKTYLIRLIQRAFGDEMFLPLDEFVEKLESFASEDGPNREVDVIYYIICVRLTIAQAPA